MILTRRAPQPAARTPRPKRGQCPVADHAHPLAKQLFAIADEQRVALSDIAARSGLGVATLVIWKYRHAPTVTALEAALNVLGFELAIRERR